MFCSDLTYRRSTAYRIADILRPVMQQPDKATNDTKDTKDKQNTEPPPEVTGNESQETPCPRKRWKSGILDHSEDIIVTDFH